MTPVSMLAALTFVVAEVRRAADRARGALATALWFGFLARVTARGLSLQFCPKSKREESEDE